ncbi:MAG: alanine racemase [Acidimicrobiales bacterium]
MNEEHLRRAEGKIRPAEGKIRPAEGKIRPAWAEVDLDALAHNVRLLCNHVAPAQVCAVVKADAYGHGSVPVAEAALRAGATWLAVALPSEGIELRLEGIEAPILVLAEPPLAEITDVLASGLTPTLYTADGVEAAVGAAQALGLWEVSVQLKVDTGMHRVGARPGEAARLARAISSSGRLRLQGFWTHLAVADEPADPFTGQQLECFDALSAELSAAGIPLQVRHAANSAGAIWHPRSRYDLVRVGLAMYGYEPRPEPGWAGLPVQDPQAPGSSLELRPVLSLCSRVALVRQLGAGERVSYGRGRALPERSWVATVPIGYADGVPRRLFDVGMDVLVGGQRRPLAGTVTMDQVMVDCGPDPGVAVGDEVVFIGSQGGECITADDWASALGTISYEVLCGIGPRVPRVVRSGSAR